jgi:hypothetical protein
MPQPVKISDTLLEAAREAAPLANRSVAAQVEHWAALGRSVEGSLTTDQATTLKRAVREPAAHYAISSDTVAAALAQALGKALSSASRAEFSAELSALGQPSYGTDPALPGFVIRNNPDGTRTAGQWINGDFEPLRAPTNEPVQAPALARSAKPRRARS